MHTPKAPIRLLPALVCFVAVLWLPANCWRDLYEHISSAQEAAQTAAVQTADGGHACTTESPELVSRMNTSEEEYQKHNTKTILAGEVLYVYKDLFWRQPNVYDVGEGFLRDDEGGWTDTWGITVWVTEKVDQSRLPPDDRIPDLLEGVPVRITDEEQPPRASESTCDYNTCIVRSSEREENMAERPESIETIMERIHEVRLKYDPLFWRQPNVHGVGEGFLRDDKGGWTETVGINVKVTRKVDQSALPPQDRIPDCLEGVPVKITEGSPGRIIPAEWPDEDTGKEETDGSD